MRNDKPVLPEFGVIQRRAMAEGTFAALLMAAGATLFVLAPDLVRGWAFSIPGTTDVALEPSFFPRLASTALVLSALIVALTIPFRHEPLPLEAMPIHGLRNVLLGLAGIAVYLVAIGTVGFVVSSTVFIVLASWLGGYRRPVVLVVAAVMISIGLRLVFRYGLHVGLPTGFLF